MSFGSKAELFPYDFCAALLSKKTAKPVKIIYTREEEFLTISRHGSRPGLRPV
jgi:CO/xanthine dehydrogenase Mo-binding subunit